VTRRFSSGGRWEQAVGYSRAVAAGDYVFVSGCTSVQGTELVHEGDAQAQTAQAIANVGAALTGLGASLADVVSTRMLVTDISRWAEYGQAHGEAFGDTAPAATMAEVRALIDPRMLVEVEAIAYRPGIGQPAADQPAAGQPAAGQPEAGQPAAGQPAAGQPAAGQPEAGRPAAGGR
jgi:enamine deaminase RidA (YjgF/YER057c/UK114 family)